MDDGLQIRRAVLGDEYVDRVMRDPDDVARPFQELVTEYVWGAVWARQGLSRKTRSLITLAMLTALNQPAEVTLHVRAALRNGCTEEEIREVFIHAAAYCGAPAGVMAFAAARPVLSEAKAGQG